VQQRCMMDKNLRHNMELVVLHLQKWKQVVKLFLASLKILIMSLNMMYLTLNIFYMCVISQSRTIKLG